MDLSNKLHKFQHMCPTVNRL